MRLAILCFIIGLGSSAFAKSNEWMKMLESTGIPKEQFGIHIQKAGDKMPLLSVNEDKQFIPASLTKLITAVAVLDEFPAGHKFVTELRTDTDGNLYLVGDGDPGFVSESMWVLVNNLTRTGVKEFKDIIADDNIGIAAIVQVKAGSAQSENQSKVGERGRCNQSDGQTGGAGGCQAADGDPAAQCVPNLCPHAPFR